MSRFFWVRVGGGYMLVLGRRELRFRGGDNVSSYFYRVVGLFNEVGGVVAELVFVFIFRVVFFLFRFIFC